MFNSHWLYSLGIDGLLELAKHSTVAQMLARADFNQRYKSGNDITILEFLYPLFNIKIEQANNFFNILERK